MHGTASQKAREILCDTLLPESGSETLNTSFGGSIVIVGNGTLEVGAALADIRASVTEFSAALMHSATLL